jgi:hypothetical protein
MSIKDRGYPFPDAQHKATACVETYGFTRPCLPVLETATHKAALIFLFTVMIAIITTVPSFRKATDFRLDSHMFLSGLKLRSLLCKSMLLGIRGRRTLHCCEIMKNPELRNLLAWEMKA